MPPSTDEEEEFNTNVDVIGTTWYPNTILEISCERVDVFGNCVTIQCIGSKKSHCISCIVFYPKNTVWR